jgi:hypothetical protein
VGYVGKGKGKGKSSNLAKSTVNEVQDKLGEASTSTVRELPRLPQSEIPQLVPETEVPLVAEDGISSEPEGDIISVPDSPEPSPPFADLPLGYIPPRSLYKPLSLRRRKSVSFAEDLPTKRRVSVAGSPESSPDHIDNDDSLIDNDGIIASTPLKPSQLSRIPANERAIITSPPCTPILKQRKPPSSDPDDHSTLGIGSHAGILMASISES